MPLEYDYPPSFLGRVWQFAFSTSPIRIRLTTAQSDGSFKRREFEIRCTSACRILQGASDVTVTTSTGRYTPSTMFRRVTVTKPENAYLSVIRDSSDGTIEIASLSESPELADDDPPQLA